MNLLARSFPAMELFAASLAQASALGAALVFIITGMRKRCPDTFPN